ncbi:MAG: tRNA (guanosine(46)-N7)-methyltransferase TrmB [Firmicutes bacterium]|nr:tRNA (guanosine(46)-N7)-methyltransferase TrmB [Bacillota bacterium]
MRLRKVPYAPTLISKHPSLVYTTPEERKGHWAAVFMNNSPIEVEVGCGKGQFIIEMSKRHPDKNFIGIEKYDSVVIRGLEKLLANPLDNAIFIQKDATDIDEFFVPAEISGLYLNFSDPWPKKRQAKRRLTHPNFLNKYKIILKNNASIKLKTDNFGFFEYSMMQFNSDNAFFVKEISMNYHGAKDNVPTEFEEKFVEMGKPIFYLHAVYHKENLI